MPIIDLFSKRQKRERGEMPDVFQYEALPQILRVQVVQILREALGNPKLAIPSEATAQLCERIHGELCKEFGQFSLAEGPYIPDKTALEHFVLTSPAIEHVLDIIELTFRYLAELDRAGQFTKLAHPQVDLNTAIAELNGRFLEHGIGYQFESGRIIRIDSTLLHSEVVRPALQLLSAKEFAGADAEYLKAHDHYRAGEYSACLVECLKSLESTMKIICEKRCWHYDQSDRAKKLIETCFDNNLLPQYLQSQFTSVRCSLESGVPTVRNKVGGHGQGTEPVSVPPYLAEYLLHLTATSILLLVRAEQALG